MEGTEFTRFGQLLGQKAAVDPTRVALFTSKDERARTGLYFVADLDTPVAQLPTGSVAILELLVEDDKKPQEFRFDIPKIGSHQKRTKTLYLGLTEAPFNTLNKKDLPKILAWKIIVQDSQGKELAASTSPLWQY